MLKTHLRTGIVAALVFVMAFTLATPAFAAENSDIAAAEDAVREAQENYNLAVEKYNKALEEYNTAVEKYNTALAEYNNSVDVANLKAERENLSQVRHTVSETEMLSAQHELDILQRAHDAGADNWEDLENARYKVEFGLQEEQDKRYDEAQARIVEIDAELADKEPKAPDSGALDAAKDEMDRCELELNNTKENLEKLQQTPISPQTSDNNTVISTQTADTDAVISPQPADTNAVISPQPADTDAVISPQTGDNNTVYLFLVMLILASAGVTVCAKRS